MRILGLDYGSKTIGVAVSDYSNKIAFGVEVITRPAEESIKSSIARLKEIIREYDISTIVLGYPKKLDNTASERCEKTILFKERLSRNFKRAEIVLWDERYSTWGAHRALNEAGLSKKEEKQVIDKMAAVFILQGYLEHINNHSDKEN